MYQLLMYKHKGLSSFSVILKLTILQYNTEGYLGTILWIYGKDISTKQIIIYYLISPNVQMFSSILPKNRKKL